MKVVQPIRNLEKLAEILSYLKATNERNYIMFMLGIHTGLRISDILKLRVRDVKGNYIDIKEEKRDKNNRVLIIFDLKKALKSFISGKPDHHFLIKSRKGKNKAIRRETAYQILNDAARHFGVTEIGTHTLRKTFGYHFYQETKDIATLQDILNHSNPDYTLRYIGINQDKKDTAMKGFRFKLPST
ncbi:tyrosine-type recombinase/integrase [Bacillus sp. JJ1773]|uniref:tyrosine-type recombinase/integrase n=1 Tax=Bacillus sp. JJ1773 TaxID=3122965 RepID=UPI0030008211